MKHINKFLIIIAVAYLFVLYYFYLLVKASRDARHDQKAQVDNRIQSKNVEHKVWKDSEDSILIMLQQSPVQGENQFSRLSAIDKTWAKWSVDSSVHIMGVVANTATEKLSNIALQLLPTKGAPRSFTAFYNMLAAFYGGAGAVLSKPALKLITLVWMANMIESFMIDAKHSVDFMATYIFQHVPLIAGLDLVDEAEVKTILEEIEDIGKLWNRQECIDVLGNDFVCDVYELVQMRVDEKYVLNKISIQLSDTMTLEVSRTATRSKYGEELLWELTREGRHYAAAPTRVLIENCLAKGKWELDNPGIMVAHCLQKIFHVPFQTTVTHDSILYLPPKEPDSSSKKAAAAAEEQQLIPLSSGLGERFNCYDPLRTAMHELDEWYVDGKRLGDFSDFNETDTDEVTMKANRGDVRRYYSAVAQHPISFHYVESVEATILYQLLSKELTLKNGNELLSKYWPQTKEQAGTYARPLKSRKEADTLLDFLMNLKIG